MTKGVIPTSSVPGWPSPPDGLFEACETALAGNGYVTITPSGVETNDIDTINTVFTSFVGSATQLAWLKTNPNGNGLLDNLAMAYLGKFAAGFNYVGPDTVRRTFQIDATSQFNIDVQSNAALGAILNAEAWSSDSYFIAADNSHMPLATPQAMRSFALAVKDYIKALILNNRVIKDQIAAATDIAALKAIDINTGWPDNP